jgi:hypothetical protein
MLSKLFGLPAAASDHSGWVRRLKLISPLDPAAGLVDIDAEGLFHGLVAISRGAHPSTRRSSQTPGMK